MIHERQNGTIIIIRMQSVEQTQHNRKRSEWPLAFTRVQQNVQ